MQDVTDLCEPSPEAAITAALDTLASTAAARDKQRQQRAATQRAASLVEAVQQQLDTASRRLKTETEVIANCGAFDTNYINLLTLLGKYLNILIDFEFIVSCIC